MYFLTDLLWGRDDKAVARADQRTTRFRLWSWLAGKLFGNRVLFVDAIWDYKNPRASLVGPKNDLAYLTKVAKSYGYSVKTLTGSKAVRANVIAALEQAVQLANEGKRVRFAASHHGSQVPDRSGDEADRVDGALYLWDGSIVLDDEVGAILQRLKPDADFGLFLDVCFSGEFPKGILDPVVVEGIVRPLIGKLVNWIVEWIKKLLGLCVAPVTEERRVRAVPAEWCKPPKSYRRRAVKATAGVDNASVWTACGEHQTSEEARQVNGLVYGEGLYAVCRVIETQGSVSFGKLARETSSIIAHKGRPQRPECHGVASRVAL